MEEEGQPSDFLDVLDILDGRADPLSDDEPSVAPPPKDNVLRDFSDEGQEMTDDESDHDMDIEGVDQFMPSGDEGDVEALDNLGQFISNLDPSNKRKTSEGEGAGVAEGDVPRKKRRLFKERNEAGAENEFVASGKPKHVLEHPY